MDIRYKKTEQKKKKKCRKTKEEKNKREGRYSSWLCVHPLSLPLSPSQNGGKIGEGGKSGEVQTCGWYMGNRAKYKKMHQYFPFRTAQKNIFFSSPSLLKREKKKREKKTNKSLKGEFQ